MVVPNKDMRDQNWLVLLFQAHNVYQRDSDDDQIPFSDRLMHKTMKFKNVHILFHATVYNDVFIYFNKQLFSFNEPRVQNSKWKTGQSVDIIEKKFKFEKMYIVKQLQDSFNFKKLKLTVEMEIFSHQYVSCQSKCNFSIDSGNEIKECDVMLFSFYK